MFALYVGIFIPHQVESSKLKNVAIAENIMNAEIVSNKE